MTRDRIILPALALAGALALVGSSTPTAAAFHGGGFHGGGFHGGGGFRGGGWHGGGWGGGLAGFGLGLGLGLGYPYYGYYDYPYYGGCYPHRFWWHGRWHWRAC